MTAKKKTVIGYVLASLAIIAADQALKAWVVRNIPLNASAAQQRALIAIDDVDRAALPEIPAGAIDARASSSARDPDAGLVHPGSAAEAAVRSAFATALGLDTVDVGGGDDFFLDLGGDSLSAVICLTISERRMRRLFSMSTLSGIGMPNSRSALACSN